MVKENYGFSAGNFSAKVSKSGKTFVAVFSFGDWNLPQMTLSEVKQFIELCLVVLGKMENLIEKMSEQ